MPLTDNARHPFEDDAWTDLERRLLRFGGFSSDGIVDGAWGAGGKVYRDRSRIYTVSLASWTQLPEWPEVIQWVQETFRQEAIYIEVGGIPEIFGGG